MDSSEIALLAIARFGFLTLNEKLTLWRRTSWERDLAGLTRETLERLIGRRLACRVFDPAAVLGTAEGDRKLLTRKRIAYTFYEDRDYPPQLREIHDPPFLLFYRGELPDYERPMLGIVGTRNPTGGAGREAFELGYRAACAGIDVVSGLARGIDGFAHEGNLAGGGRTVAVLGCGIDFVYPSQNRKLGAEILASGGAILSEYPPGEPPLRYHFPARNRILSGLCRGVVVVEAPARSGALITVDHALDQGRDLFVHRRGLVGPASAGTRRLAEEGAKVIDGISDVLEDWGYGVATPANDGIHDASRDGLASLMRGELTGQLMQHRGRYFRRMRNG